MDYINFALTSSQPVPVPTAPAYLLYQVECSYARSAAMLTCPVACPPTLCCVFSTEALSGQDAFFFLSLWAFIYESID